MSENSAETKTEDPPAIPRKPPAKVDRPCHVYRESLFSTASGFNNYRGFFNLCLILLLISNARVAIENLLSFGFLVDPFKSLSHIITDPLNWPCALVLAMLNVFILIGFGIEFIRSKIVISQNVIWILHGINFALLLIIPAVVIFVNAANPFSAIFTLGIVSIVFLKLISYAQVNRWCREQPEKVKEDEAKGLLVYPNNLTLQNLYYFMLAPTLCYQLSYPRNPSIRKWFLFQRVIEMLFFGQLLLALTQQWIIPNLRTSVEPLKNVELVRMFERLLRLAIPNHVIWLIFFYWLFHSCLNAAAELLGFGDREFYRDWWNAESTQQFWKTWNIPVHRWCVRHLYVPMLKRGYTERQAKLAVFLVSAFFHEYLISIPLRMFRWWAFLGMMAQAPLFYLTENFLTGQYGNFAVWISLILGQPLCVLAYFHDFYILGQH